MNSGGQAGDDRAELFRQFGAFLDMQGNASAAQNTATQPPAPASLVHGSFPPAHPASSGITPSLSHPGLVFSYSSQTRTLSSCNRVPSPFPAPHSLPIAPYHGLQNASGSSNSVPGSTLGLSLGSHPVHPAYSAASTTSATLPTYTHIQSPQPPEPPLTINQHRLNHAASSTSRGRGVRQPCRSAQPRPSLGGPLPFLGMSPRQAAVPIAAAPSPTVNIIVRVLLAEVDELEDDKFKGFLLHRFRVDNLSARLRYYGLEDSITFSIEGTVIGQVLQAFEAKFAASPAQISFRAPRFTTAGSSSAPPPSKFCLLAPRNKGKLSGLPPSAHLDRHYVNYNTRISDMLVPNTRYTTPTAFCFNEGSWIVRITPIDTLVTALLPHRDPSHRHTCITKRVRYLLNTDSFREASPESRQAEGSTYEHDTVKCPLTSDEESDGESDGRNEESSVIPSPSHSATESSDPAANISADTEVNFTEPAMTLSQPAGLLPTSNTRPAHILSLFPTASATTSIPEWMREVASSATDPLYLLSGPDYQAPPPLNLHGRSLEELADKLEEVARCAAERGDCSQLLAVPRKFTIDNGSLDRASSGPGVEVAVWTHVFKRRLTQKWWEPRRNEFQTVACSYDPSLSDYVDATRRLELKTFGILVSMHIVALGVSPAPYSPFHFLYFLHDCKVHSIPDTFVKFHDPELYTLLLDWQALGPSGQIEGQLRTLILQHWDRTVDGLENRTDTVHRMAEQSILYRAHIARDPPNHAELESFLDGLDLKSGNGWSLKQAIHAYESGTEKFIEHVWSGSITGYASIQTRLVFSPAICPTPVAGVRASNRLGDLSDYIIRFLQGVGTLSHGLIQEEITNGTMNGVDFEDLNNPAFRARLFYHAVVGSSKVLPEATVMVFFCEDDDILYETDPDLRDEYIKEGALVIQTCLKTLRIPKSFLIGLLTKTYGVEEPASAEAAVEHWLLTQLVNNLSHFGGV